VIIREKNVHPIQAKRLKTRCPECLAPIWLKQTVELWHPVTCPECHMALEVVSLLPLTLDYMPAWDMDDIEPDSIDPGDHVI
jgi:lysine biosynthesis protein LysW